MKKVLVSGLKKLGEKVAEIPVNSQSIPAKYYQAQMPQKLRDKMLGK